MILDQDVGMQGSERVDLVWSGGFGGGIWLFTVVSTISKSPYCPKPRDLVSFLSSWLILASSVPYLMSLEVPSSVNLTV